MRKNIIKLLSLALALVLTMGSQPAFASSKDSLPVGLSLQEGYYNVDGNIIIYINWDAFAEYYYDLAQQGGTSRTPVLNSLIAEGVHFTDMNSGLPSITNPMQTAILSGAWPETTMNPYRYYNPVQDKVIGFARENEAENMAQAMVRQGFRVASVNQFVLESREEANVYHGKKYYDKGCAVGNKQAAYFTSGDNGLDRFDGMIALIKGEPVGTGANRMQLDKLPNFIAGYMDDLDALGHNETAAGYDGVAQATTEQGRRDNVLNRLELLDAKLGELVAACKATGLYDRMTFVLGTDHGMHPFGSQNGGTDDYTVSKLQGIYDIISEHGVKYEYVAAGKVPLSSTQLVIVSAGLQLQFTLKDSTVPQATMDA
ncbi:MAG: alkaline phosphatase family protein, partial [Angelakisella sp.]